MSAHARPGPPGAPVVLMYHRVAVEASDPWGLCVSPRHFAQHLDVLRSHATVLPLGRLQRQLAAGGAAAGSVAITFDDGYADNLLAAAPLLERAALPATVFVATGYLDGGREYWWDELDRLLLRPGSLPERLAVAIAGIVHRVDLGRSAHYPPAEAERHRAWRAYETEPPTERHAAYLALWERLHVVPEAQRWEALRSLRAATGGTSSPRAARRQLGASGIAALASSGLVDIGAHTVTHPALPLLTDREQRFEIRASGGALAEILGRPVEGFSYPHGRYTAATVGHVRDAGFAYACAATPGPHAVASGLDAFVLGRVMVPDCDGDAFHRLLAGRAHA